ncbi:MAG: hypothetical protein ABIH42_04190, partial [Planctomycetota bacterium]
MEKKIIYCLVLAGVFCLLAVSDIVVANQTEDTPVAKRDMYSNHYSLGGRHYRAEICTTPINYMTNNGEWKKIDTTITASSTGKCLFENTTNVINSFYDSDRVVLYREGKNYLSFSPESISVISQDNSETIISTPLEGNLTKTSNNVVTYSNKFSGIHETYTISTTGIKHNIILETPLSQLQPESWFAYNSSLFLAERLELFVNGIKQEGDFETSSAIEIRSTSGELRYVIPKPFAFENEEKPFHSTGTIFCKYRVIKTNSGYKLSILTPTNWLVDNMRRYPVTIDPTIEIDNQTWASLCSDEYLEYFFQVSKDTWFDSETRGALKWDITSITDGSTINSVGLRLVCEMEPFMPLDVGVWDFTQSNPPAPYTAYPGAAVFNDLGGGTQYTSFTCYDYGPYPDEGEFFALARQAATHLQANLPDTYNWFQVGLSILDNMDDSIEFSMGGIFGDPHVLEVDYTEGGGPGPEPGEPGTLS